MADDPLVRTDTQQAEDTPEQDPQPQQAAEIDWKAKAREWERRAKANAAAARRLAELEEAQKSEQQKLAERAERAEREAREARAQLLRTKIAAAKGLPPSLATRLRGETEEEITADADDLLATLEQATPVPVPGPSRPVEALRPGSLPASEPAAIDLNEWLRRQASRR